MSRKTVNHYPDWIEDLVKTGIAKGWSLDNIWEKGFNGTTELKWFN